MGKTHMKNGTPVGNEHLCKSCTWGQLMTGYRESDVLVICTNTSPNMRVPFVVHECSEFQDKHRPDWNQMQKLAIEIRPTPTLRKTRGFNVTEIPQPVKPADPDVEEDEENEDEAAVSS